MLLIMTVILPRIVTGKKSPNPTVDMAMTTVGKQALTDEPLAVPHITEILKVTVCVVHIIRYLIIRYFKHSHKEA